jgi:D-amino peptidase
VRALSTGVANMRILVSVDIEGVAGVVHPEQTRRGNADYERARRWMTAEANAAIRGAFAGGAKRVTVNDSHGDFRNLLQDELDTRADVLLGKPRDLGMMAGVDADDCKAVFLVGWHARSGAAGILSHTISSFAFTRVGVNGVDAGEAALYGAVAAEFSVPVALFTGDDAFVEETAPLFPGAIGVVVKQAHGNRVATSLSQTAACDAIEAGAREAAGKCLRSTCNRSRRRRAFASKRPPWRSPTCSRRCRSCDASMRSSWNSARRRCVTPCAC